MMTLRRTGRQRQERGIAVLSLLTLGIILSLAILFVMAIPLTQASDAKAKSRSAADAAALAGADWVRVRLRNELSSQGWLGGWDKFSLADQGLSAARNYAQRNDARLVQYDPPSFANRWQVHVVVEGRDVKGQTTRSQATARFSLPSCSKDPAPPPSDPPSDPPPDDAPPPPPPPDSFSCGGIRFDVPTDGSPPLLPGNIINALFAGSDAILTS